MSTARRPLGVQGRGKNPVTQPAPVGEGAPHRVAGQESGSGHLRMGVTADKLAAGRAARALHSEAPALQRLVGLARPLPEPPAQQRGCPPRRPPAARRPAVWDVGDRLLGPGKRSAWSAWPSGGRAALPRALARRPAVAERRVQATRGAAPR